MNPIYFLQNIDSCRFDNSTAVPANNSVSLEFFDALAEESDKRPYQHTLLRNTNTARTPFFLKKCTNLHHAIKNNFQIFTLENAVARSVS